MHGAEPCINLYCQGWGSTPSACIHGTFSRMYTVKNPTCGSAGAEGLESCPFTLLHLSNAVRVISKSGHTSRRHCTNYS